MEVDMHMDHTVIVVVCWSTVLIVGLLMEYNQYFRQRCQRDIYIPFVLLGSAAAGFGTLYTLSTWTGAIIGSSVLAIACVLCLRFRRMKEFLRTLTAYCIIGVFVGFITRILFANS